MNEPNLFDLNANWVHIIGFVCAIGFALAAIVLNYVKKSPNPVNSYSVFLDLLRGVSVFPLALFTLSPLMPGLGKLAMSGDTVLLSLGACGGLLAILDDWWKSI